MTIELGLCVGLGLLTFILAYMTTKVDKPYFKWFLLILTFISMTLSFDILRRVANISSLGEIGGILEAISVSLIIITGFLIFLFFIVGIKNAIELWMPKKKSFRDE